MKNIVRKSTIWLPSLIGLVILLLVSGAVFYVTFEAVDGKTKESLLLALGKAVLQLGVIVILGGVASALLTSFARSRDTDRAVNNFRVDLLRELRGTYYDVKKSRRILRASGLTTRYANSPDKLSNGQQKQYIDQMDAITDSQLAIERMKTEVDNFPDAFSQPDELGTRLRDMEDYLRRFLHEYEKVSPKLLAATPVGFAELEKLSDFTASVEGTKFKDVFSKNFRKVLALIRGDLLPLHRGGGKA